MIINEAFRNLILKRSLITISIILFIRIGTFLPVPGINHNDLAFYIQTHSVAQNLVSTFSGNDTFIIGLFILNIFPYINASILIQLILSISPKLAKMQKEGDLADRRYISQLTRLITLIWAIIQSVGLTFYLKQVLFDWNYILVFETVLWLTTGAMIVLWLSELITDYGLGNGTSILIYTNIISNLPNLTQKIFFDSNGNFQIISTLIIFVSVYGIVFLQEGFRSVPLISIKQLNQQFFQDSLNDTNYLPLRFNQAGVMPIILTSSVLVVPSYLNNLGLFPKIDLPINVESLNFLYWIIYFSLILLFSSFYSWVVLNPKDISDQLQKMGVAIPRIRPGKQTAFYLQQVMKRVTLIGALMLATLITVPNFLESLLNLNNLNQLSTTSLLILAGVLFCLLYTSPSPRDA